MSDVDWLVVSVVVGDQGALDRGAKLPVEPDPGGQGGQPLGDPDPQAVDGVGAVAFQAELVFEGVEDGLNPLADPAQVAEPVRLITTVGAAQGGGQASHELVELPSRQPLVSQDDHARRSTPWRAARSTRTSAAWRSPSLGLARHQATGIPSGPASTYSLSPQ